MSRKLYITLILILFLLPFVSWYYLKSGLEWRRKAQEAMSGTALFPEGEWTDVYGQKFTSEMLSDHVSLIFLNKCDQDNDNLSTLRRIYDQFKETNKALYIILDDCIDTTRHDRDSIDGNTFVFQCKDTDSLCRTLKHSWPEGKPYALVDRRKTIRAYYAGNTTEEKRLLLEHMALLLPRERSEKVELKRGKAR